MSKRDPDDLLAQEYEILLKNHENLAARAVAVKAWSVSLGVGALGLAYSSGRARIILLAVFAALIFWLLEALNRTHQKCYEPRIQLLEQHFRGAGGAPLAPFQVFKAWDESHDAPGRAKRVMEPAFYPTVMLPHVFIIVAGLVLFGMWKSGAGPEAGWEGRPVIHQHGR